MQQSAPVALALLFLAGCAGTESPAVPGVPSLAETGAEGLGATTPVLDAAAPPRWSVGDWWEYHFEFPAYGDAMTARLVVVRDEPERWIVSSTDHNLNLLAEFGHHPSLTPVRKADLHQTVHGDDIPFLEWPLADGKTWNTPYRGADATWTVKATDLDTTQGRKPGFQVSMKAATGETLDYAYAPAVGWWTRLTHTFGGPPVLVMTLRAWGHNHTTPVGILRFTEHVHRDFPVLNVAAGAQGVPNTSPSQSFTLGAGSLAWAAFWGGAPGTYGAHAGPVGGGTEGSPGFTDSVPDQTVRADWGDVARPPRGQWGILAGGEAQGPGFMFVEILEYVEEPSRP